MGVAQLEWFREKAYGKENKLYSCESSQTREHYKNVSDIDIAVYGGDVDQFAVSVDEETSTLLEHDVVNLDGNVQK